MDFKTGVCEMGLKEYLKDHTKVIGIFLETAHPGKFKETVESALEESVIDIAYSIEHNLSLLHSLISTQYGNVEDLASKFRQNKFNIKIS